MNSELTTEKLLVHYGHKIVIAKYGDQNIALECEDCYEVLADGDTK
jgi:hypothetical protein